MSNSSIWPIDRTLSSATTPRQRGSWKNGNKGVLYISQSSSITGASLSDCLVSYPRHSLCGGSYPSVEIQSVYSTAPANRISWLLNWIWYKVNQQGLKCCKKNNQPMYIWNLFIIQMNTFIKLFLPAINS